MSHTPTPWEYRHSQANHRHYEIFSGNVYIAKLDGWLDTDPQEEKRANAELIVRAVNSHQAMKEALEGLMYTVKALDEDYDLIDSYKKAQEALTFANGGKEQNTTQNLINQVRHLHD